MIEASCGKGLTHNALIGGLVVPQIMMQQLEGHLAFDAHVLGLEDLSHAALAQGAADAVATVDDIADRNA